MLTIFATLQAGVVRRKRAEFSATVHLAFAGMLSLLAFGCGASNPVNGAQVGGPQNAATPPTSAFSPLDPGPLVTTDELAGIWWIEAIDGYGVELGRYAAETPWVEFDDGAIAGNLGCNTLMATVLLDGSTLRLEKGSITESDCSTPNDAENLMWSEQVLRDLIRSPEGFEVRISDTSMRWGGAGHTATFVPKDRRPEPGGPPLRQQAGRLDCTPSYVAQVEIPDIGPGAESIALEAGTGVVAIEAGDPLQWWGVDASGGVVVGVFLGDAQGAPYTVLTCE